jgi:type IV pilus assembly protein PilW
MTASIRSAHPATRSALRQAGMTMIEIMVGITLGLFVVLVIYQVYDVAERYKRNTTTSGDAQTTGIFSMFFLSREIGNAGAGIAIKSSDNIDLFQCPGAVPPAQLLRPIPVLITDGGADDIPDSLIAFYGSPASLATGAPFTQAAGAGSTVYQVQSPLGFAVNDTVIAVRSAGNNCQIANVDAVVADLVRLGAVNITHTPGLGLDMPQGSKLINLGQLTRATKTLYDVDAATATLRTTDLLPALLGLAAGVPNPVASNVINFKAQYGIDTTVPANGTIDAWVPATAGSPWDPVNLAVAPAAQIQQIKAVRIGIVIRGDEPDRALSLANDPAGFTWTMFPCPPAPAICTTPPLTGTIFGGAQFGYRYRVYETVIPLRNAIWNGT